MKSTNFQTQMAHLPKMIFLELTNFLVPLGPFHYEKSQKNPYSGSRFMMTCQFQAKMVHSP